jgi:hypothetical protein
MQLMKASERHATGNIRSDGLARSAAEE